MYFRDTQWQYLVSQYNRAKQTQSDSGLKQVIYMAVVMFMQSFYFYVSHIDLDISSGGDYGGFVFCCGMCGVLDMCTNSV